MKFEDSNFGQIVTGVINFQIVAVNPTLAQLNELGVNFNKEPEYISSGDNGQKKVRIDFWLKPTIKDMGLQKIVFFLEDIVKTSKSGKTQYINSKCESSWADSVETLPDWLDRKGIRECKSGEDLLMGFLRKFANVATLEFDNFNSLFNGNVTEIRDFIKVKANNQVQLLCGEKNGYQAIYNKFCMNGSNTKMNYWDKHLEKEAANMTIDYQGTTAIKIWSNPAPTESQEEAPSLFS